MTTPSPASICRQGFTLVEMLVVVGLILLLMTFTSLIIGQAPGNAYMAKCASNMHQIHIALAHAALDNGGQSYIDPVGWTAITGVYLDEGPGVYVCPEDDDPSDSGGGEYSFMTRDKNLFWGSLIAIAPGPRAKVLRNVKNGVVLGLEDWDDFDYNDVVVEVTTKNGMTTIKPLSSSTAGDFHIVRLTDPPTIVWSNIKRRIGEEYTYAGGGAASYGMNGALTQHALSAVGRILLLDYESTVARVSGDSAVDDWGVWWDDANDRYLFARHPGNRINVMTTSGSITSVTADEIDPDVLEIRNKYWALPGDPD